MLLIPVAAVPLAILLFYGFGGGSKKTEKTHEPQGLNTRLPDPMPEKENPLDKLSIYRQADKDSARIREQITHDPFFSRKAIDTGFNHPVQQNESLLTKKLAELETNLKINERTNKGSRTITDFPRDYFYQDPPRRPHPPEMAPDPEMEQLNALMQNALDLKYPERVKDRMIAKKRDSIKPFMAKAEGDQLIEDDLMLADKEEQISNPINSFYEYNEGGGTVVTSANTAIRAVIHQSQSAMNGSAIRIRLDQDMYVSGIQVPAGTVLFGIGQLHGDRYQVSLQNINYENYILPVSLEVYGYDGMKGIPVSDGIAAEAARQGTNRGIQSLRLTSLDPSIGAQAATAGIETAKNLISRRTKLIKIPLKADYAVLLKNSKN